MQHRLLIVEDDASIAELVGTIARGAGFEVRAITSSHDIAALHDGFRPDVIVLDVLMPEMDGFDVLNYLHECDSDAKIVLLSGSSSYREMAEKMAEAHGLRIAANLAKPFRAPSLRLALEGIRQNLMTFAVADESTRKALQA
ncbi:MAG: response regulator [Alphaproteobacteria bacterium]